ncbi:LysR family transcriptional regulator [Chelatococcus asaccharovorans]|uniref:LysR family transcriptional regulator n=1 Tax=Chelatococcus asaccharovorans TaxID=28210 RepID=UPI00224C6403|nr:LysR family transcriptional regulator [Chelatococcus asaccharovorans]CAH1660246.1 Transcriptional regulator, LysR family [Chelatococcus asaccharovorans]CAH1683877.1 Transcriptional regulator, LysR family [Chelatococcus asaccharovorans]
MDARKPQPGWDDLRHFLAVARTGTVSAAAAQVGTEHTTVSRRIRALERELGETLFHKSNTGYELTAAGQRLVGAAEDMESAYLAARSMAGLESQSVAGVVRIGAPDGLGAIFLAPRLKALTERHPRLAIELMATARLFSLSKREADIAISLSMPRQMRVVSRRLTDYRLHVYGTRAYLQGSPPIRVVDDLKHHPFVSYIEDLLFAPELNYLSAVRATITPRIRSTNLLAQLYATLAGSGLCIMPTFMTADFPDLTPVLPERIALTRSFYMHIHEDNRKVRHINEVGSFIAAEIARSHALFNPPAAA